MENLLALTLHSTLIGTMLSFMAVTTPTVFKTLDEENLQKFLRFVFPRLFKFCLILVMLAGILFLFGKSFFGSIISITMAFGFLANAYVITPKINKYRDLSLSGDTASKKKFKLLHLLSVSIFLLQILGSCSILFAYSMNHIIFFFKNVLLF